MKMDVFVAIKINLLFIIMVKSRYVFFVDGDCDIIFKKYTNIFDNRY